MFAPKGKPEFHAEWLRDEPCDATTTCPRKTGVWCQLLPGDGEHEIRGLLQHSSLRRLARYFESYHVRSFEPVTARILGSLAYMRGMSDDCLRIALSGMWQVL